MYKEILRSIENIELFPIIALILFFSIFIIAIARAFLTKKSKLDEIANSVITENSLEENEHLSHNT